MASQYFSSSTSLAAFRIDSSASRASSSGSGGGSGAGARPPPLRRRGVEERTPAQALLVVGPLARVAQHVVGLAEPDEDGLELVPQVAERGAVVDVGVEALGEAEVGLLDLRLADGPREPEDLEVVAGLEPLPGLEDLPAPLRGLLVVGRGRGRRTGRAAARRRRGGGAWTGPPGAEAWAARGARGRRATGLGGRAAARDGAAGAARAGRRASSYWITPVDSRPSRLICVRSAGSGIICTISRALATPSTRERTKPSSGDRVSLWKRSRGSFERARTRSMSPRP